MSQQGIALLTLSVVASGAIAAYRGVGFNQAQATVAGQKIMGISRRPGATGADLEVVTKGTAVAETGAAIAAGVALAMDASGRVVTATALQVAAGGVAVTSTAANGAVLSGGEPPQFIVGYSLPNQTAAGAGEFIEILLN